MAHVRPRLTNLLKRFARARQGATAIEFAIIATPFLVLFFGVIELAMVFMVSLTLQNATDYAGRAIRTGQFQTSAATTKSDFKTLVCKNMNWLQTPCATKLTVDVQTLSTFTSAGSVTAANPTRFNPDSTCWSVGGAGDIVLVRTYYQWDIFTPLLNASLVNMGAGTGKRLISATSAFRNEPWTGSTTVGARC